MPEVNVKVAQLCPTLCDPMGCSPPDPLSREFSRQEYWSGFPSLGDLPNQGIEPRSPTLQVDSLLSELSGWPKNTGVGSLSLLQGIFPTQESNRGLLHWRRILYRLSCQGSPLTPKWLLFKAESDKLLSWRRTHPNDVPAAAVERNGHQRQVTKLTDPS